VSLSVALIMAASCSVAFAVLMTGKKT
jgi:hypothetical protein